MGYNAGGTYFENHRSSGFDTVANDVSCVVELRRSKPEADMTQTKDWDINVVETLKERTESCWRNFTQDRNLITKLDVTFAEQVLPCPCTHNQAKNDPRFKIDTPIREGTKCFIQHFAASGYTAFFEIKYGRQCCYDNNG